MITCERCRTENVEDAQYCDECGLPLLLAAAAMSGAATGADARTPILHMLDKPASLAGDVIGESDIVSPDAPTRHDGESSASGVGSEVVSTGGTSSSSAARATPVAAVMSGARSGITTAHATLIINRGRSAGKEFPVHEDEAYIGRWDADSGIFPDVDLDSDDPEAKVSRRHARITRRSEQYFIEDLGSTNGTFVNRGRRLLPGDRQLLNDGDEIIIGKTFLRFHVSK
jgi:hypothetical protein